MNKKKVMIIVGILFVVVLFVYGFIKARNNKKYYGEYDNYTDSAYEFNKVEDGKWEVVVLSSEDKEKTFDKVIDIVMRELGYTDFEKGVSYANSALGVQSIDVTFDNADSYIISIYNDGYIEVSKKVEYYE